MTAAVRDAGDSALLLELEAVIDPRINNRAIALAAALRTESVRGVRDVVSTYRSVAVYFDPLQTDIGELRSALRRAEQASPTAAAGRHLEIPVAYGGDDGPDLAEVASFAGLSADETIARHTAQPYRVYMLGFLPGFAYMGTVDEAIAAPRHATPRTRVPAGAVGIAGRQTGVYPMASPGGWQIIGRTDARLFDPERLEPALFAPGDTVTFVRGDTKVRLKADPTYAETVRLKADTTYDPARDGTYVGSGFSRTSGNPPYVASGFSRTFGGARTITILSAGLFTTIQDTGRWGHQANGVPVSGPMDPFAHRAANAVAGNGRDAAALELTLTGPEIRFDAAARFAIAGADLGPSLDGHPVPLFTATAAAAGSILRFGERRGGARAYVAFEGGVATTPVLGSRSTHALAADGGFSGRPLRSGDRLALATPGNRPGRGGRPAPLPGGGARLRVLPGPQDSFFNAAAYDVLQSTRFTVTPQSNRMGYRLGAGRGIPLRHAAAMISDATFTGAVQVPPSGAPILLMADRQTSGGYPQMATVITADLPLAAQLAPGDWIEFEICSRAEAIAALLAQEAELGGFE